MPAVCEAMKIIVQHAPVPRTFRPAHVAPPGYKSYMRGSAAASNPRSYEPAPTATDVLGRLGMGMYAATVALNLLICPMAAAEDVSITFPASSNPAIRAAQQTLVEAWGEP
jgi:hypothetical protein